MLPSVLLQKLPDEALGHLAGVAEELLVKVVVHGRDVPQRLLLRVAKKRRRSAQAETATRTTLINTVLEQTKTPAKGVGRLTGCT